MNRTASGPKFILDTANNILDEIIPHFTPSLCIQALSSSTNIKNTEVSSKAFVLIAASVIRLTRLISPESLINTDIRVTDTSFPATSSSASHSPKGVNTDIRVTDTNIPATSSSVSHSPKKGGEYDNILRLLNKGLSARTSSAREGCRCVKICTYIHIYICIFKSSAVLCIYMYMLFYTFIYKPYE
jgi:hypothetical protein